MSVHIAAWEHDIGGPGDYSRFTFNMDLCLLVFICG
jgi:hypothetical protein